MSDLDAKAEENALRRVTKLLLEARNENERLRRALVDTEEKLAAAEVVIGAAAQRTKKLVATLEAAALAEAQQEANAE